MSEKSSNLLKKESDSVIVIFSPGGDRPPQTD
jgi:hypothetical protein